jgi:aminopeptidase YwaD
MQHMVKWIAFAAAAMLFVPPGQASAQTSTPDITATELREHVKYLASDALEGRGSGAKGNAEAARYIAANLKLWGLKPAGDNGTYLQPFEFVSAVRAGEHNTFVLESSKIPEGKKVLTVESDFRPFGFSSTGSASAPIVFVGYGISAPDKSYDDYAGIDVKDKIVLMLRYAPDGSGPQSEFQKFTSFRIKARSARDKGAAGMILITGPADDPDDSLIKLATDQGAGSSGLPAMSMKRSAFEQLLAGSGWTVQSLQDSIRKSRTPHSFEIAGATAKMETEITRIKAHSANVAAFLEGNDPALKNEVIILGAHMDHLGFGGPGSGSMMPDTIAIHNGADDNASGTAALLELAQAFAAKSKENKRTLLFLFFSGEELGTLGSNHYVSKPYFPLTQTVAMLNMDMVGRLQNRALTIGGSGTSSTWGTILPRENADSAFVLTLNPDGFGPSDHSSFYGKDIPVLFFFTGVHDDYHKPSDDWEKINYAGEEKITKFVRRITHDIDTMAVRPPFTRVQVAPGGRGNAGGDSRGFTVTLGIVPDVGESTGGMKISGVRPNGAAEKAGLKTGDVITSIGGKKVLNVYDYMGILGELKAGQEVEVVILRDGVTMTMTATMQKRN